MKIDWSQTIPNILVGLIVGGIMGLASQSLGSLGFGIIAILALLVVIIIFVSKKVRGVIAKILKPLSGRLSTDQLLHILLNVLVLFIVISISYLLFLNVYHDESMTRALLFIGIAFGYIVGSILSNNIFILRLESKKNSKYPVYMPIPLSPGLGNAYLRTHYVDPPITGTEFGGINFQLHSDSLIFDTNGQLHYYLPLPKDDGGEEVELHLPNPVANVKSAYFLINSSNSKTIYHSEKIGEVRLVFREAPPIVQELILGKNVREWCIGNTDSNYVRQKSDAGRVWQGSSLNGVNAVMDCLEVPVPEMMRKATLEKIIFVHKKTQKPPEDKLGVHFIIFGISLEVEA